LTIDYFSITLLRATNRSDDVKTFINPDPTDTRPAATTWRVDPDKSVARFTSATMWGTVPVKGRLGGLSGTLAWDGNAGRGRLNIQTAAVPTGLRPRDRHLRGNDFLAAPEHPAISFDVQQIVPEQSGFALHGELLVRGVHHALTCTARGADLGDDRMTLEATKTFDLDALGMSRGFLRMIPAKATADVRVVLQRAAP
jgi:polyisoprenoid-binding protein YceI